MLRYKLFIIVINYKTQIILSFCRFKRHWLLWPFSVETTVDVEWWLPFICDTEWSRGNALIQYYHILGPKDQAENTDVMLLKITVRAYASKIACDDVKSVRCLDILKHDASCESIIRLSSPGVGRFCGADVKTPIDIFPRCRWSRPTKSLRPQALSTTELLNLPAVRFTSVRTTSLLL